MLSFTLRFLLTGRSILPLNTRWSFAELAYAIKDGGAKLLITDRDPGSLVHSVEHVLSTADYELMVGLAEPLPFADVNEEDLAGLFYTGGTTGKSKGVMLSHRNIVSNALHSQFTMPLVGHDRYLLAAPMFHAARNSLSPTMPFAWGHSNYFG